MLAALLLAAAGGPVVYFTGSDYWETLRQWWAPKGRTPAVDLASYNAPPEDPAAAPQALPVEGTRVGHLGEVLRFNVTSGWVLQRWPRVSTGLAELPLQGYRVPLVTGTKATDLAGSLTYYFNSQQQVQRITFQGTTGDARELVRLLTTRYEFARRLTNDPGLFVYEVAHPGGKPVSVLKIRPARVVKSSDPRQRFEVDLVMERPS